jgi:hypothetical protein
MESPGTMDCARGNEMKTVSLVFLVGIAAAAQAPGNVIACDAADADQCRVTIIEGRSMREMVHEGTSIAVGKPMATSEGDYRVFVRVSQIGSGKAKVSPKNFSGLFSDPEHTRFGFYDKAAEISQRMGWANGAQASGGGSDLDTPKRASGSGQVTGTSKAAKLGMSKVDPNDVTRTGADVSAPRVGTTVTPEELYLGPSTLRQGDFAEGFVYFKKPRRLRAHVGLDDTLYEIDVPVNGVVFRFNEGK